MLYPPTGTTCDANWPWPLNLIVTRRSAYEITPTRNRGSNSIGDTNRAGNIAYWDANDSLMVNEVYS